MSSLVSPQDPLEVLMEEKRKGSPRQRFTLTRKDERITVNYSAGDYRILTYMATKEQKTITEMAHELFIIGLQCKQHRHKRRMAELEEKRARFLRASGG